MQVKLFTIPIIGVEDFNDELNAFLQSKKIIEIEKELVHFANGAYWCIYITYLEPTIAEKAPKERIDYVKELAPEIFTKFSQLCKIRKEIAQKENVSTMPLTAGWLIGTTTVPTIATRTSAAASCSSHSSKEKADGFHRTDYCAIP